MTFEQWWTEFVLVPTHKGASIQQLFDAKQKFAACWNAANENAWVEAHAMRKAIVDYYGENLPPHLKTFLYERLAVIRNARVKEIS